MVKPIETLPFLTFKRKLVPLTECSNLKHMLHRVLLCSMYVYCLVHAVWHIDEC